MSQVSLQENDMPRLVARAARAFGCAPLRYALSSEARMKAKDIFGVAVRFIGLLFLYQSLSAVPVAISNVCPVFPHFYWKNVLPGLILVGWPLLIAYWLVRGAPLLMRLAYGKEAPEGVTGER